MFGAEFFGSSNLEQVLSFRTTFEQNIGFDHISSTKKSTISHVNPRQFNLCEFLYGFRLHNEVNSYL